MGQAGWKTFVLVAMLKKTCRRIFSFTQMLPGSLIQPLSGKWLVGNAVCAADLEKRGEASQGSGENLGWQTCFSIVLKALWRVLDQSLKLL